MAKVHFFVILQYLHPDFGFFFLTGKDCKSITPNFVTLAEVCTPLSNDFFSCFNLKQPTI